MVTKGGAFLVALAYAGKWFAGILVVCCGVVAMSGSMNTAHEWLALLAVSAIIAALISLWIFFTALDDNLERVYGLTAATDKQDAARKAEDTERHDSRETHHEAETE